VKSEEDDVCALWKRMMFCAQKKKLTRGFVFSLDNIFDANQSDTCFFCPAALFLRAFLIPDET
jgi:hypothetical protein